MYSNREKAPTHTPDTDNESLMLEVQNENLFHCISVEKSNLVELKLMTDSVKADSVTLNANSSVRNDDVINSNEIYPLINEFNDQNL